MKTALRLLGLLFLCGCVAAGGQSVDGNAEGGKISINPNIQVIQQPGMSQPQAQYGYRCYNPMNRMPMCMMNQPNPVGGSCFCIMPPYGQQVGGVVGP
ncbi:hypothetical protein MYG64_07365 [Ensifer adhaerens]|uniref:hypothetical protein n=1 Tax=Ensifer adhaerens TaxID=106592 RepID=UPI002100E6F9|nr:hypothetical protein [Ensifer adhaerens]UTV38104.1 hypothetical protein MYG64_07365 [Ensifer adhaerens]